MNRYFRFFGNLVLLISFILLGWPDMPSLRYLGPIYERRDYGEQPFTWNDFRKTDSIEGGYEATISSSIVAQITRVRNYTPAIVVARMNTEKSWYVKKDDGLLEHELYHFKLTELTARQLRKALENYHFASYDDIARLVNQYRKILRIAQKTYDVESAHNKNMRGQKRWKQKIDEGLAAYPY